MSRACPPRRAPEHSVAGLCAGLVLLSGCGWALWLGSVSSRTLSTLWFCAQALSSSSSSSSLGSVSRPCPPLGCAPELCQLCGWEAGREREKRERERERQKEKTRKDKKRKKERKTAGRARALVCYGRRDRARSDIRSALRARFAERKTEKEKLKEREKERERKKERKTERKTAVCSGRRAHAPERRSYSALQRELVCSGRRAHAPERRAYSALQRERQRKRNLNREREREKEREQGERALARSCAMDGSLGSCPPLVLCAGLCGWALSSSCPCLGRAPELCVAGLCVRVLSSSCPCLGRAPELCGWSLWPGLLERSVAEQMAMSMPKIH